MVKVLPPKPRSTITEVFDGVHIVIPFRGNLFLIGFLTLWTVGVGVGLLSVAFGTRQVQEPVVVEANAKPDAAPQWTYRDEKMSWPERIVPLAFAGVFLTFGTFLVCWQLAGREVVWVTPRELILRKEALGIGRSREFDRSLVTNLRVAPVPFNPWDFNASLRFWGFGGGTLAFDYGAGTYRFGNSLEEAEAQIVAAALRKLLETPAA